MAANIATEQFVGMAGQRAGGPGLAESAWQLVGLLTFILGLRACGGWENFTTVNAAKLHMFLPASNPDLPWTGVASACGS